MYMKSAISPCLSHSGELELPAMFAEGQKRLHVLVMIQTKEKTGFKSANGKLSVLFGT